MQKTKTIVCQITNPSRVSCVTDMPTRENRHSSVKSDAGRKGAYVFNGAMMSAVSECSSLLHGVCVT